MEIRTFWAIIESAQSGHPFDEALVDVLAARPRQDILEYHERFGELQSALYRWDVWAAACLPGDAQPTHQLPGPGGALRLGLELFNHRPRNDVTI